MHLKKTVLFLLIFSLYFTMPAAAYSKAEKSGAPSEWAVSEVDEAIKWGIVPDRLQADYRAPITREEFAGLLVKSALRNAEARPESGQDTDGFVPKFSGKLTPEILASKVRSPSFADCDLVHVKAAYILGFVNGVSDTEFNPGASITRQEAAAMMANYLQSVGKTLTYVDTGEVFDDSTGIAVWARDAVDVCFGTGVMMGTGTGFSPLGTYTREQAILCVKRAHKPLSASVNLRGKVLVAIDMLSDGWSVGKDWAALSNESGDKAVSPGESKRWEAICKERSFKYFKPTAGQFDLYLASRTAVLFPLDRVYEQKEFIIDGGYLVSQWFSRDYLIKYYFVPGNGYVSREQTGNLYGRGKTRYDPIILASGKDSHG